jgi:hypothetical protein
MLNEYNSVKRLAVKWTTGDRFPLESGILHFTVPKLPVMLTRFPFRNIEFSDSIHRPGIKKQTKGNTTFLKLELFPSSGAGKKPILLGPLERASPNHWIQFPKRRVSFSLFFNTRTMDRVRKLNISESYTPSSESYSNYLPDFIYSGYWKGVGRFLRR